MFFLLCIWLGFAVVIAGLGPMEPAMMHVAPPLDCSWAPLCLQDWVSSPAVSRNAPNVIPESEPG